jgi:phosphatidylinositol-4,5-bisphosphate 3-kinase
MIRKVIEKLGIKIYTLPSDSAEQCEVKMSKKRPLWMVWHNPDQLADLWYKTYSILFKNGDGE